MPLREVVEDPDLVSCPSQAPGRMAPHVTGSARHQYSHRLHPILRLRSTARGSWPALYARKVANIGPSLATCAKCASLDGVPEANRRGWTILLLETLGQHLGLLRVLPG